MLAVKGYGSRIRQIQLDLAAQLGRKVTLEELGRLLGRAMKRKEAYKASSFYDWINERNEPPLAVFVALGQIAGRHPAWIAFGDVPRGDVWPHLPREQVMHVAEGMRPWPEILAEVEAETAKARKRAAKRRA